MTECGQADEGFDVEESIRVLLLLLPRIVNRAKRMTPPPGLANASLQPRHRSLLAHLQFDGAMSVNDLARSLELAPPTVSLMISDLSRQGIVLREEDCNDRRRTIVSIQPEYQCAVEDWLADVARAWRVAVEPLTPRERALLVRTLCTFEREVNQRSEGETAAVPASNTT